MKKTGTITGEQLAKVSLRFIPGRMRLRDGEKPQLGLIYVGDAVATAYNPEIIGTRGIRLRPGASGFKHTIKIEAPVEMGGFFEWYGYDPAGGYGFVWRTNGSREYEDVLTAKPISGTNNLTLTCDLSVSNGERIAEALKEHGVEWR